MRKFLIPALVVLLPIVAFSQITIKGKIMDGTTQQPLAGASIQLISPLRQTLSGDQGEFVLTNLNQEISYSLITRYIGYKTDTTTIKGGKEIELTISLQPLAVMQEEFIVQSIRAGSKTPVAFQNISKKELASINFGQDLPILLSNSISTVTTSDAGNGMGYTALRIRGTDMTRINVTINGIPLNDPESHNVFWVDLPDFATSTDNIQIQRGAGTSTNGSAAFGASINLKSSELQTKPYAEISASAGSFNTLKTSLSFGTGIFNKHYSLNGRISKLNSDGFVDRAKSDLLSYYLSGTYTSSKDMVKINIFSGKEKTYQAWDGIPLAVMDTNRRWNGIGEYTDLKGDTHYYNNETDNYTQTQLQVHYSHSFNRKLYLNTSFHYTAGAGYYEQYKDNDSFEDYGLQPIVTNMPFMLINGDTLFTPDGKIEYTDLIRRKHLANHFTGATWSLNHSLHRLQSTIGGSFSTYHGNHFGKIIWAEFASNSSIDYEWYRSKAVKNDMNVYLKNEFAFNSQLSLWLDLQFRHINYSMDGMDDDMRNITQKHNFNFFNPKTGFTYKISNLQSFYASVAIANREPNRDNFVDANPSQPAPERELLIDFESGYSLNTDAYNVSATAFYMLYKDQLVLTGAINDVGAPVMINVPDSYRTGVEISASFRPLSFVTIEPALSLSRNKIKTFTEYIDNWDSTAQTEILHKNTDLAFAPSMVAGNKLSIKAGKHLDASLISKYVSEQFIDNTGDASHKLDSYFVNNILIRYSIQPKWCNQLDFSVMLNNIFNAEYESNAWVYSYIYEGRKQQYEGYFPQAGFNFMAGINVKL